MSKADEPQPHPPKEQLPNISYCITSPPPWPEAILLGFQHYLVMIGTAVIIPTSLVPQMGGGNEEKAKVIQTLLFVAGLNTLLRSLFGSRLPAVIGGSYTFVPTTISIILVGRFSDTTDPVERFKRIMRATQGSLIVASTLQIVLGFSGLWRNITRFLSPLSVVPLVSLVGFRLYEFGFPGVAKCVEIGLPQLILIVFVSQYVPHVIKSGRNIFGRFAVLFSVAIVWIYAHLLTVGGAYNGKAPKTQISCRTDRAGLIDAAPWIRFPYPFQWGAPSFDAGESFAMMMASFVALVEYFNEYTAINGYGPVHTGAKWFNDIVNVPFSSEAFIAGCLAYFLDNTLHRKDNVIRKDRGKHWWDKFRSFKSDSRSEEFYSLPFSLNKYLPSV